MTHTTHNDEEIAKAIYQAMPYTESGTKPKWVNGGNSLKQDEARRYARIASAIQDKISRADEREKMIDENTSDGYHTFKELYTFRKMYNAALFNEWFAQGKYDVHKSKKHSDGELCFGGGWFVVYAITPYGQISNHYELTDWDLFRCDEREVAAEWDGHTAQDIVSTLQELTTQNNNTV